MPRNRKPSKTLMWPLLGMLSMVLTVLPLASCTTLGSFLSGFGYHPDVVIDTSCQVFGTAVAETGRPALPLIYHSTDAADTKAGARAVNRAYDSLCPETPAR